MALVTVQRSSISNRNDGIDKNGNFLEDPSSVSSFHRRSSDSYLTVRGAALILSHTNNKDLPIGSHQNACGDIQNDLQNMMMLIRPQDTLKLAVRLENKDAHNNYNNISAIKNYNNLINKNSCSSSNKRTQLKQNCIKNQLINTTSNNDRVIYKKNKVLKNSSDQSLLSKNTNENNANSNHEKNKRASFPLHYRYLAIVTTSFTNSSDDQSEEEANLLLGVDLEASQATVGLVFPIMADTSFSLDGDGGLDVSTNGRLYNFKPVSLQALWSTFQCLTRARDLSIQYKQFNLYTTLAPFSPSATITSTKIQNGSMFTASNTDTTSDPQKQVTTSHQTATQSRFSSWLKHYNQLVNDKIEFLLSWHCNNDTSPAFDTLSFNDSKRPRDSGLEAVVREGLKNLMLQLDFEEVTTKHIREQLELNLNMDLSTWKRFIDDEMIVIMRQMEKPSLILPFLYLGSEWNASNLEELKENNVTYILNITKEIANFYPETFQYMNVRVSDEEDSDLLIYWEATHKFISQARDNKSNVLVHCKMGVSRSASTVIAFVMKEEGLSLQESLNMVKNKRSCIQPNNGFLKQLEIYQGILDASKQRHSHLWKSVSSTDLVSSPRHRHSINYHHRHHSTIQQSPKKYRHSHYSTPHQQDKLTSESTSTPSLSSPSSSSVSSSPLSEIKKLSVSDSPESLSLSSSITSDNSQLAVFDDKSDTLSNCAGAKSSDTKKGFNDKLPYINTHNNTISKTSEKMNSKNNKVVVREKVNKTKSTGATNSEVPNDQLQTTSTLHNQNNASISNNKNSFNITNNNDIQNTLKDKDGTKDDNLNSNQQNIKEETSFKCNAGSNARKTNVSRRTSLNIRPDNFWIKDLKDDHGGNNNNISRNDYLDFASDDDEVVYRKKKVNILDTTTTSANTSFTCCTTTNITTKTNNNNKGDSNKKNNLFIREVKN